MAYTVLARKYRPQTFADLAGQEHVSRTLSNAIESGRVAHAFLFTGARGVGKTTTARLLAKALNCEKGPTPEPCNACDACTEITAGNSLLQGHNDIRVERVVFLTVHILEQAALLDALADRPGSATQGFQFLLQRIETTALDARSNTAEGQVHDLTRQPHRLEQLCSTV